MVADIARTTYDPTRGYRSLIAQQGRVTLEADNNEAATIAVETLRLETIDTIGPTGTPDGGYKVSSGSGVGAVTIGPGIFYLGGWRLELDASVDIANQPDWIDATPATFRAGNQLIALLLTEQSICAVEDQALREVALGGPDSAARARLMQHFLRIPMDGDACAEGATVVGNLLNEDGVTIDPATLQFVFAARLQAGFVPGPPKNDPCTPVAAGGYLGADNQMVRVTVINYDATAKTGTLLWGWNNASLLYRVSMTDPVTLTLTNVPVDEEHAPQLGQMVEILRTETDLGDDNLIADHEGFVTSLVGAYSSDTGQIVLADPLPAEYQNNKYPLFVRLWQAKVPFNAGQVTPLDNVSGITVTVTLPALPTNIAGRPFWRFAVRPATPQSIYPQRYLDAPQPPEGPRQWLTDLAVVEANAKGVTVVADCRVPFGPHTGTGCSCCGIVVGPKDVAGRGGLQAVIDGLAGSSSVLSLKPGTYPLSAPLLLDKRHAGLRIEGCTAGVVIEAGAGDPSAFRLGLLRLNAVTDITLRRLTFVPPAVPSKPQSTSGTATIIAVLIAGGQMLTIDDCAFKLSSPTFQSFGGGIVVLGATEQVTVRGNSFTGIAPDSSLYGVLAWVSDKNATTEFDQWEIEDNKFQDLLGAVLAFAQLGQVRCFDNIVVGYGTGFVFAEANLGAANAFTNAAMGTLAVNTALAQAATTVLRRDVLADVITRGAPIIDALAMPPPPQAVSSQAHKVLADEMLARGSDALATLAGGTKPAGKPAARSKTAKSDATANPAAPAPQAASVTGTLSEAAAGSEEVDAASIVAEIYERQLIPAIRIQDNEITLSATMSIWTGIGVLQSPSDQTSTNIINGNRVTVPSSTNLACGLLFPGAAVVSGNIFLQQTRDRNSKTNVPCLIVLSESSLIQVSANVVQFGELVLPARTSPPATASWDFLNTVD